MTYATAQRTVDKSFETGKVAEQIAAAQFTARVQAMSPLAFAEMVGEMLVDSLNGDLKAGQTAMLWLSVRKKV